MASQICRPYISDCRSSINKLHKTQNFYSKQSLGFLSLRECRLTHHRLSVQRASSEHREKSSNNENIPFLKLNTTVEEKSKCKHDKSMPILKLVAAILPVVLPVVLLRAAPAFASTVAVASTAGNAAKGFRVAELITSAWTGLMAGCLHTLTGPDHLAALAPLSIGRTRMEGAVVGALWGCGHDAGQIIFGLLFLVLKDKLHIDLLRTWSARVVGVTLLAIGAIGIKEAQETPVPCLAGEECEADYGTVSGVPTKRPFGLATFGTGVVHGLQPDALLVILPALALPSRLAGVSFLFMFLLGTVVAMASYTAFVGSCSEMLQKRVPWITQRLSLGSSLIAIAVGFSILLGECFGVNLF